jgi:hypothetical protein
MYEVTPLARVRCERFLQEQSAEENIWTLRRKNNRKIENTVQLPLLYLYSLLNKNGIFGVSNIQGKDELCMHNLEQKTRET